ncbi:fimbria/pilus periplasmic chaperone [Herbaspirillum rhizosphaerae]|uniref:Fimbria/pilus periplasmic chaperone n=1 Tax=Herbaspirillum rhizosphaerae TaxID=346179 RepID=A0ABW8ZCN1_9BURK
MSPVVLELSSARTAGVVKIVNNDTHDVSLQIRAYDWTQKDSQDSLEPTQSLIISPPVFTVAPGASQTIRIVSRRPAEINEIAYRLLVDEIPTAAAGPAINFKFRISMPIFIAPNAAANLKMGWSISAGKTPKLIVTNTGNRRGRLLNLALTLPNGKKITPPAGANPYTLAGMTRQYVFDVESPLPAGSLVKMTANSDSGPIDTELTVTP